MFFTVPRCVVIPKLANMETNAHTHITCQNCEHPKKMLKYLDLLNTKLGYAKIISLGNVNLVTIVRFYITKKKTWTDEWNASNPLLAKQS